MKTKRRHSRAFERRTIRLAPSEVRVADTDDDGLPKTFTAVVLRYNVLDDYRTKFKPGVFSETLASRLPRVVWAHDWTDPIGRYTEVVRDDNDALELAGEFDNFEDVPSARRAARQLKSGTIDQFSVGFFREEEEYDKDGDFYWITSGDLVEASPVLSAAVPGTSLTGMRKRSSGLLVPLEDVEHIVVQAIAGNIGAAEALSLAAEAAQGDEEDDPDDDDAPAEDDPDVPEETPEVPAAPAPEESPDPATVQPATGPEEVRPDPDPEPDADVVAAPDLADDADEVLAELDEALALLG